MIDLSYLSVIRLSGTDAGDFLHNQLSADILALSNHEATYACYCEPKGRVLALILVARVDDDFYIILSAALAPVVASRLKIYVMRSKVDIEVLGDSPVSGLNATDVAELANNSMLAIPEPAGRHWFAIPGADTTPDTKPALSDSWKLSELERGISWLGTETSGQFLPQMLGFDQIGAVNYRKGCYPGQEIVARTHYLGKVKRHPRVLTTDKRMDVKPLQKVQLHAAGQPHEAVVVDCAYSEGLGTCLLVISRLESELVVDQIEYEGELSAPCPIS